MRLPGFGFVYDCRMGAAGNVDIPLYMHAILSSLDRTPLCNRLALYLYLLTIARSRQEVLGVLRVIAILVGVPEHEPLPTIPPVVGRLRPRQL